MELKVIEEKKNKLILEVEGEDHTLCNAIRKELWNDKNIKVAGYFINHPLVGVPKIVVESSDEPKKSLIEAAKRLKKANEKLRKEVKKELK